MAEENQQGSGFIPLGASMFASFFDPYVRLFTGRAFGAGLVQLRSMHQNRLYLDEMPESLKREIVAASLVRGTSVARVARRYDVNANQVFAWRRRYRGEPAEPAELCLLPVRVSRISRRGRHRPAPAR